MIIALPFFQQAACNTLRHDQYELKACARHPNKEFAEAFFIQHLEINLGKNDGRGGLTFEAVDRLSEQFT